MDDVLFWIFVTGGCLTLPPLVALLYLVLRLVVVAVVKGAGGEMKGKRP